MTGPLDIRPDHLEIVRGILRTHAPQGVRAWAFGSRAAWRAKEYSDLDLCLRGKEKLPAAVLSALDEAFADSDLPWKVDIVDMNAIDPSFRAVVDRDKVALPGFGGVGKQEREQLKLGDHCLKIGSGATPRGGKETYLDHGPFSLIRSQNVYNNRFSHSGLAYISDEQAAQLSNVEVMEGDVLLNITGDSVARVCQVDPSVLPARVNQHVAIIRPNPDVVSPRFLRYYFVSLEMQAHMLGLAASGATRNALTKGMIEKFEVPDISLPKQRAIASTLGSLDDKIDLNRRMNETLEAIAKTIFRDWFVDFGPTRAKMAGRKPYLATEIWSLFPDKLDEDGKPQGWETGTVGDCFHLTMGQSPPGSTYNENGDGPSFFQGRTDFGFRYPENRKYCTAPTRTAERDDTLISVRAPVGDINMAWDKCCIGRGVSALRHKSGSRSFTYYSTWAIQQELRQYEHTGTIFGAINKKQFEALKVIEPDSEMIKLFDAQVGAIDDRIRLNSEESRILADIRDLLLPKLMSGELRVQGAKRFIKRAV